MTVHPIDALVPHAGRMRWLDGWVEHGHDRTAVVARVRADWPAVADGLLPAVAALELIAQAAAVHAALSGGGREAPGMVVGCPSLDAFVTHLAVGDALRVEVSVTRQDRLASVDGVVSRGGMVVARGRLSVLRGAA